MLYRREWLVQERAINDFLALEVREAWERVLLYRPRLISQKIDMWGIVIGTVAGLVSATVLLRRQYILENSPMNSLKLNYGRKKEKWPRMHHDWYFQYTESCLSSTSSADWNYHFAQVRWPCCLSYM